MIRRWFGDRRAVIALLASLTAAALVCLLGLVVVSSIQDRGRALDALKAQAAVEQANRKAAVQLIDDLLVQVQILQRTARHNAARLARLEHDVELLQQQVRDMGGQPVVTDTFTTSAEPQDSPTPRPSPSSSPKPTPSPTPSPRCPLICLTAHVSKGDTRGRGDGG